MLCSLQVQTLRDWECVFVDDGSTDDTRAVVQQFAAADARIRYFFQDSQGPSAARNRAIAESRGRYFQLLDADDLIESRKLELQVAYLHSHPEVDLVYGQARYFRDSHPHERTLSLDGGERPWTTEISASGKPLLRALIRSNLTAIHAPLFRRELVARAGGFDTTRRYVEDWDFWLRCALEGGIFHFQHWPDTRALVRSHGASLSRSHAAMLAAQITMRQALDARLHAVPGSAALSELNQNFMADAEFLLGLEKTLEVRFFPARLAAAWQIGWRGRGGGRLSYALTFPFIRQPAIRSLLRALLRLVKLRPHR